MSQSKFEFFKENEVKNPLAISGGYKEEILTTWRLADNSRQGNDSFLWGNEDGMTRDRKPAWTSHTGDIVYFDLAVPDQEKGDSWVITMPMGEAEG